MSEEIELRRRLEQAEAFARTLQSQRDAAEQNAADLRAALAQAAAELETARAVAQALAAGIARDGYCPICHQTESVTLQTGYYTHHEGCALAAYDTAVKART